MTHLILYTDGAARGNPGESGIGVVLYNGTGEIVKEYCRYLGTATNNVAEYQALIAGLTLAKQLAASSIDVFMDSELLVRQVQGIYRVKNEQLQEHYRTVQNLLRSFKKTTFTHVPREKNKVADMLANRAIDNKICDDIPPAKSQLELF